MMTPIYSNGNSIIQTTNGLAGSPSCCCSAPGCVCNTNTCGENCACLSVAQPSIKICDVSCQDWCTGGLLGGTPVPGGSMINPIPWYGNVNEYYPFLPGDAGDQPGEEQPQGYCTAVWNLGGATTALCFHQSDASPGGYIRVSLRCLQATPALYDILFRYYQCPGLTYTGTGVLQRLCVVDGILKGCVILDLEKGSCGRPRPNCTMHLIFGA